MRDASLVLKSSWEVEKQCRPKFPFLAHNNVTVYSNCKPVFELLPYCWYKLLNMTINERKASTTFRTYLVNFEKKRYNVTVHDDISKTFEELTITLPLGTLQTIHMYQHFFVFKRNAELSIRNQK